jgi:hypothetical protein
MAADNWSNEKLVPLAIAGDVAAVDELLARGNTLEEVGGDYTGRLLKTLLGSELIGYSAIKNDDVVVIADGQVITVNGNPYP